MKKLTTVMFALVVISMTANLAFSMSANGHFLDNLSYEELLALDEQKFEATLDWSNDTKVLTNHFKGNTKTNWRAELDAIPGEKFIMFYEDWDEKSKRLIPRFDRSAKLNAIEEVTYMAVDCKNARHFCRAMYIKAVPYMYYIKDYDHFYAYESYHQHKFMQVFMRGNYEKIVPSNIAIFADAQRLQMQEERRVLTEFQESVLQIDILNYEYLQHPNQLVLFYSEQNSYSKKLLPMLTQMSRPDPERNPAYNNVKFAAINSQKRTNVSITHIFKARNTPLIIFIDNTGKYVKYEGELEEDLLFQFATGGYLEQALSPGAVQGDILKKIDEIKQADDIAKNSEKVKNYNSEEQVNARKEAIRKMHEREEAKLKEKIENNEPVNFQEDHIQTEQKRIEQQKQQELEQELQQQKKQAVEDQKKDL